MSLVFCSSGGFFFFFKRKTAYEMRISDWSSDVCSSDLRQAVDLGREDQPPVGFVDEEIGTEVGDVAAGFEPDGRDADVARHIVAAARLQFGDESADAA